MCDKALHRPMTTYDNTDAAKIRHRTNRHRVLVTSVRQWKMSSNRTRL